MTENPKDSALSIPTMVANIENELAVKSLFTENKEAQKAIKNAVSYIILKAIAISKDPKADKRTVLALYETAKELITNSYLEEDENSIERLHDLVNAIIDGDDIGAQLRDYNNSNKKWMDTKMSLLESKLNTLSNESYNLKQVLANIETKIIPNYVKKGPSVALMVITGFFAILFTIVTSVVIISAVLTNAINTESFTMEQKKQMQQFQQYQQQLHTPAEK